MSNRLFPEAIDGAANFSATIGIANTHLVQGAQATFINYGVFSAPTVVDVANTTIGLRLLRAFDADYYERIFIYPNPFLVLNPRVGIPNTYAIWNAQLNADEIQTRTTLNAVPGLTNTAIVGTTFAAVEEKRFDVTVGSAAPLIVDETYNFTFVSGKTVPFQFLANRANVFIERPLEPLTETLEYKTQVMSSHNGTEQRISMRAAPRSSYSLSFLLPDDKTNRTKKADILARLPQEFLLPRWHEGVTVTQQTNTGGTIINGNFSLSDIRVGMFVLIMNPMENDYYISSVSERTDINITLNTGVPSNVVVRSTVYPLTFGYHREGASVNRFSVNAGTYSLTFWKADVEPLYGYGATINTYSGAPVLEAIPLTNEPLAEAAKQKIEIIDYDSVWEQYTRQPVATLGGARKFFIETRANLQYFKKFLDNIVGRREPFFLSTYREDLFLAETLIPASNSIVIVNDKNTTGYDYIADYQNSLAHRSLEIVTEGGTIYRTVVGISTTEAGNVRLTFSQALPGGSEYVNVLRISFLEKVRLDSDTVIFRHYPAYSEVDISVRTVNE